MASSPSTHKVIIAPEALIDLQEIADYIHGRSPQNALRVADKLISAIDGLSFMPDRFRVAGRSRARGSTVHAMTVYPYVVYYRVERSTAAVFVLEVRHGARQQPRRFP